MKRAQETTKEIAERILANLSDHQGCAMGIGLTQALMRDCKKIIKRETEKAS